MTTTQKIHKRMDIKKGDTVLVLAGKDAGKQGKVIQALPTESKVVVEGINIVTRHQKPRGANTQRFAQQQSGRIQKPAPMHRGKVMLVCPRCDKPTRVGHAIKADQNVRVCKKCGEQVSAA